MNLLTIETVRARLTVWYVTVLAAMLVVVGGLIYVLLARALYTRIDDGLQGVMQIAMTSLANDLAEGQDAEDAARSTAAELASRQQMLAIYDSTGRLLAEEGRDDDLVFTLPPLDTIPADDVLLLTVTEVEDEDDRHRLALRRVTIAPAECEVHVASAIRSSRQTRSSNRCAASSGMWSRLRSSSPVLADGFWPDTVCRRWWPCRNGREGSASRTWVSACLLRTRETSSGG